MALCHVSELSDEPVLDIHSCHKAGDKVKAKILKASFVLCFGQWASYLLHLMALQNLPLIIIVFCLLYCHFKIRSALFCM